MMDAWTRRNGSGKPKASAGAGGEKQDGGAEVVAAPARPRKNTVLAQAGHDVLNGRALSGYSNGRNAHQGKAEEGGAASTRPKRDTRVLPIEKVRDAIGVQQDMKESSLGLWLYLTNLFMIIYISFGAVRLADRAHCCPSTRCCSRCLHCVHRSSIHVLAHCARWISTNSTRPTRS